MLLLGLAGRAFGGLAGVCGITCSRPMCITLSRQDVAVGMLSLDWGNGTGCEVLSQLCQVLCIGWISGLDCLPVTGPGWADLEASGLFTMACWCMLVTVELWAGEGGGGPPALVGYDLVLCPLWSGWAGPDEGGHLDRLEGLCGI
jgi:hypothetical protein